MEPTVLVRGAAVAAAVLLAGCASAEQPRATPSPTTSSAQPSSASSAPSATAEPEPTVSGAVAPLGRPDVLATDLEVPWGLAFLPDGSALVAQRRSGEVVRVYSDGGSTTVGRVPGVLDRGEGGLLGLALAPGSEAVLAYLTSTEGDNRLVSLPFDGDGFGRPTVLLDGVPQGSTHNGGRIVVGPDGAVWIGTGDAGDPDRAQDVGDLGGKILRIAADGSIPSDNPFPGSPVWSYGHRNVQGLAFDSAGRLWATEFGQNDVDELNLVVRGGNHGWPIVEGAGGDDRYVDPAITWPTDQASPSGLAIVDDVAYLGALRGERLWQVPLRQDGVGEAEAALGGRFGRIRTVEAAPDGALWFTTSNRDGRGSPAADDDRVVRMPIG